MQTRSHITATFLLLTAVLSSTGAAQDEFTRTDKTGWWWYHNVSADAVNQAVQEHKARIIRIEVESTSPARFTVVMVKNEGVYAKKWWWYFGLGPDQVKLKLAENQARILDFTAYGGDAGLQFAVVMVSNTGAQNKAWWWLYGGSDDVVAARYTGEKARLISITGWAHPSGLEYVRHYAAAMIANQGADAKKWWWFRNVSADYVKAELLENKAQLIDIERAGDGKWLVIMEKSEDAPSWWYYGKSADEIEALTKQNGARIVSISPYLVNDKTRYAVVMVKN